MLAATCARLLTIPAAIAVAAAALPAPAQELIIPGKAPDPPIPRWVAMLVGVALTVVVLFGCFVSSKRTHQD